MAANYRLLSGTHGMPDGRMYQAGDVIRSETDLTKTFVNKFERVDDAVPASSPFLQTKLAARPEAQSGPEGFEKAVAGVLEGTATEPDAKPQAPAAKPVQAHTSPQEADSRGRDVTDRFPEAVEQDFLVTRKSRKYFVWDIDDPDEPLNPDGAKNRTEVKKVIQHALEA